MNSRMRDGVRFPSDVLGQPAGQSGPVITYKLSPEEIEARYGPIKRRRPMAPETTTTEEATGMAQSAYGTGEKAATVTADESRAWTMLGESKVPHFDFGSGPIPLVDLGAKAEALLTLLGEDAKLLIVDGCLIAR